MASLTNTKIKNTYVSLLKVADNGQLDAALQDITDGAGNVTGVQLNTGGDLAASGTVSFGSLKDTGENITISKFVDAADGIGSNNNDTYNSYFSCGETIRRYEYNCARLRLYSR
jgi:hypothetical protein